ncbi:MAG: hypothetical protein ACREOS_00515 [Candidatus Dormibacteraceae bacterium]
MPEAHPSIEELLRTLRQVIGGRYSGKPLFFWPGTSARLRKAIDTATDLAVVVAWLDVNDLAEDVIPRRARETLRTKLAARIQGDLASGARVLILENPYLLMRYEPAPLAPLWNTFVGGSRAAVVVLPPPVPRPSALPSYVHFQGDAPGQIFVDANVGAGIASPDGGMPPC